MNRVPPRLRALAALPFLLALALHLTLLGVRSDRLPDPMATHFSPGFEGRADGWTGLTAFLLVSSGLLLALGAGWAFLIRRSVLWGAWGTAGFVGALLVLLVQDNVDAADARQVASSMLNIVLAAAVAQGAVLLGRALTRLVPKEVPARAGVLSPEDVRLPLGASEVASWSRTVGSRALTVLGVGSWAGVLILAYEGQWLFAPGPALLGLLLLVSARIRVTVDRRGLTVRPALSPWPRLTVPLDGVEGASAREIDALAEYGGWGYRVRAHRTGVVLRSGEALVVRRDGGREVAVTVPDAATASALLNALVERRGRL